jgi:hypothetical protein
LGYAAAAELPSLPWQVVHDADFFRPAVISARAEPGRITATRASASNFIEVLLP